MVGKSGFVIRNYQKLPISEKLCIFGGPYFQNAWIDLYEIFRRFHGITQHYVYQYLSRSFMKYCLYWENITFLLVFSLISDIL